MKTKLLMITSSSSGGGPKQLYLLSKGLSKTFKVSVACPSNNLFISDIKNSISGDLIIIDERRITLINIFNLTRYSLLNSINLIHSHGKAAGFLGRLLSLLTGIKLVHTYHGIHITGKKLASKLFYVIYEIMTSWINTYNIYVSNSEMAMAKASNILPSKNCKVIHNGVACFEYDLLDHAEKKSLRNSLSLKSKNILVITSCRLEKIKNLFEFIDIASKCPSLDFCILGEGPLREELLKYVSSMEVKNVSFLGHVKSCIDYLRVADIYLSTSFREGHPLSILEAMSVGLPVVCSKVAGNIDTVIQGESGYFYDLGNIKLASDYLLTLSKQKPLRSKLGFSGCLTQRNNYSIDSMLDSHFRLYKSII